MKKDVISIPFKDKIINLHFNEFDEDVDLDRLTFVDYANLHAEFLTISSLYNRVGIWKAEVEAVYDRAVLHRKIQEAEKSEHYRKELRRVDTDSKGKQKMTTPTVAQVENAVLLDKVIQNLFKKEIRLKANVARLDSLFWSVKSKEKKLDKLIEGARITPEDFEKEIVEGKWNGILIKCHDKLIKDNRPTKKVSKS